MQSVKVVVRVWGILSKVRGSTQRFSITQITRVGLEMACPGKAVQSHFCVIFPIIIFILLSSFFFQKLLCGESRIKFHLALQCAKFPFMDSVCFSTCLSPFLYDMDQSYSTIISLVPPSYSYLSLIQIFTLDKIFYELDEKFLTLLLGKDCYDSDSEKPWKRPRIGPEKEKI